MPPFCFIYDTFRLFRIFAVLRDFSLSYKRALTSAVPHLILRIEILNIELFPIFPQIQKECLFEHRKSTIQFQAGLAGYNQIIIIEYNQITINWIKTILIKIVQN